MNKDGRKQASRFPHTATSVSGYTLRLTEGYLIRSYSISNTL